MKLSSYYMLHVYYGLLVWNNGSVIGWSKWSSNSITKQMSFGYPTNPSTFSLEPPFTQDVYLFD